MANPHKTNLIKLLIKDKSDHKDLTGCTILGVIFNCVLNSHIKYLIKLLSTSFIKVV